MSHGSVPTTMKAWVFDKVSGGMEKNLRLDANFPLPKEFINLPPEATLVRVVAASLNPADIKIAEIPLFGAMIHPRPATPGFDFCGRVVKTRDPNLREGQLVAGVVNERSSRGSMAEFVLVGPRTGGLCLPVPEEVAPQQAATLAVCGSTAVQSIEPYVATGRSKVFINGGSGGTGTYMIQVAKALGCHVTVSCSGPNAQFCKDLGADEVLDYRTVDVPRALAEETRGVDESEKYDLVVDTVGRPWALYKAADEFLNPDGKYVQIGGEMTWGDLLDVLRINFLPSWLGGGKRTWKFLAVKPQPEDMHRLLEWMGEGKIRVPIDEVIAFDDVPRAYKKLRTHRTKGKIVVQVSEG